MIGSLIYLTTSRPDIMFAVCACSRFQVTLKTLHLYAVKRIFRYLKGKPKLDLWYPKVSSFDLEAYLDSDYAGANLDKKSTTGGCQFLEGGLCSWQCAEAEIVATLLQLERIYIDNESAICIVKNPMLHSKTKHIEIWHHFIRDAYEKKLIQIEKYEARSNGEGKKDPLSVVFITTQQYGHHKELASQQKALGKDIHILVSCEFTLNYMVIKCHPIIARTAWAIPEKMAYW
ncbi:hypothetical protein Tco_1041393 [Tanacetum coccineum]|uniref:Uncharacterized protein n=1 Tax=Tanacetum coccineum TaxID=301880 RepID=A0ABQ5GG15_9ASTR